MEITNYLQAYGKTIVLERIWAIKFSIHFIKREGEDLLSELKSWPSHFILKNFDLCNIHDKLATKSWQCNTLHALNLIGRYCLVQLISAAVLVKNKQRIILFNNLKLHVAVILNLRLFSDYMPRNIATSYCQLFLGVILSIALYARDWH